MLEQKTCVAIGKEKEKATVVETDPIPVPIDICTIDML